MNKFTPHINVDYPPNNKIIFEEWFAQNYKGCNTDRGLLPFFPTSYWVNNSYGEDPRAKNEMQEFVDRLDRNKKWFCIVQYDDGVLIDFKDLDVLQFNMSKQIGVQIPLLCQPHPYKFDTEKQWFCNFIGSRTHPVRGHADKLKGHSDYFISFERMGIEKYCRILHESYFTLCFSGYGKNSFRVAEAIQYKSIPVYISSGDDFIIPPWVDFKKFGVLIKAEDAGKIDEILSSLSPQQIIEKQNKLSEVYENFYTFESNLKHISKFLEKEYYERASNK